MIGYDDVVSGDSPENKPDISEDRCAERWVNGIATFTVPLGIPVDASNLEKLEAATARFGDEFLFRFDGADVTFEISDEGAGGPTASSDGIDTPDRQSGEGPAGSSPDLPADLIDRAARAAAEWTSWYNGNGWDGLDEAEPEELEKYLDLARGPAEAAVKAVASLLVEHGRRQAFIAVARTREVVTEALLAKGAAQEKTRWETRLLAALNREGRKADGAVDAFEAIGPRYAVELLRSLLTGEGENGE